jgi:hypothetical protein
VSAAAFKFMVAMDAVARSEALPALPSKMNGPASFRGVIGPSAPVRASPKEDGRPFGLGVRVIARSVRGFGLSR